MIDRSLNYGRSVIERYLKVSMPYERVLDIGAGRGDDLSTARRINNTAELFAVERHHVNVSELESSGVRVYSADIERSKLPFEDESMDVVVANQILEHTKEIFWIFHEISRVLRPKGKLILGIPNLASLHNRLLLLFGWQPSSLKNNSAHVRGFTKQDILRFLESCFPKGYALRAFGGSNFYPFPPVVARPLARIFPNMAWGIFMLFEKVNGYGRGFLEYPVQKKLQTYFKLD